MCFGQRIKFTDPETGAQVGPEGGLSCGRKEPNAFRVKQASVVTIIGHTGLFNQHTYKDNCLKPMLDNLPYRLKANSAILYRDKAPCLAAGTVQASLEEEMSCFIWNPDIPPNSPDLNPLNYFMWSLRKERVNKHALISSFDRLAKILKDEWEAISQQVIQDSINSWMSRVRKMKKSRGSHIE
ncbi:hypothetical protein BV898_10062 [Hypsibius exemplaris]|uniref:Tc1-like transposase DDE domain-containing protein n=1 Tax=Hypsibius exemplaris TaxID=2072580 RepID=A0A1W0WKS0_HYPEX|nr:hypothetical protein BV898_10062 [Hypsibius exemplaris]